MSLLYIESYGSKLYAVCFYRRPDLCRTGLQIVHSNADIGDLENELVNVTCSYNAFSFFVNISKLESDFSSASKCSIRQMNSH